jgi:peroxiredoxin
MKLSGNSIFFIGLAALCLFLILGGLCAMLLLFGLSVDGGGFLPQLGSAPRVGREAPDFELTSITGERLQLSQFRGQPVLLNFWATWCAPCLEELPVLQSRFEYYVPNLMVLAVESGQPLDEVRQVAAENELTFSVLLGEEALLRTYNVTAFPTSIFIDPDGVVRSIVVGSMDGAMLDAELWKIGVGE